MDTNAFIGLLEQIPLPDRYKHDLEGDLDSYTKDVYFKILSFIPSGARVLDVGCGTGELSKLIKEKRNSTIVGIEPNSHEAAAARELGINVYEGEFEKADKDALGVFDVVLFADVLEHLVSPGLALKKSQAIFKRKRDCNFFYSQCCALDGDI